LGAPTSHPHLTRRHRRHTPHNTPSHPRHPHPRSEQHQQAAQQCPHKRPSSATSTSPATPLPRSAMEDLTMLREALHGDDDGGADAAPPPPPAFESFDLDGVAKKIAEAKNIIVMAGAGACVPTAHVLSAVHCMLIRHAAHFLQCTSNPVDVTALHVQAHPLLDDAARGGAVGEDGIIVMTTTSITSCSRPHLRHRYACTRLAAVFFCAVCRVLTCARKRTLQTRFSCAARVCLPFLDYCCAWPCNCAKRCIASC
jgi:hypothetical protein